ncbi:MAG: diaminopimelate decarboxylase [Chloroflexi bacterium]|nr:diaminopimelate decarboxylase [Chloroflexota bacterium]
MNNLSSLQHILPMTAQVIDGRLWVAGCDLTALADTYGTPLYVYDAATLEAAVEAYASALRRHYPGPWEIAYAAKAFWCLAMAQWASSRGLGLDVVSGGELAIGLRAGFPPERIHFHGNYKTDAELEIALDANVGRIVLDHEGEIERLERLAAARGTVVEVWLRVSPGIDVHTHDYVVTGRADTKFGIPLMGGMAREAARRVLRSPHLRLVGLHTHLGSQILDATPFARAVHTLLDLAADLEDEGFTLRELSPGGGWGVPYRPDDPPTSVDAYIAAIGEAVVTGCRERGWPLPRLVIEPGRSLVARAGIALYRVGSVKRQPGRTYVLVDGGLADNPRPALYGAAYTALLANRMEEKATETVAVAGPYCESGDILIRELRLPPARTGDLLAVPVAGAYQLSMASNYNAARRPAVLWLANGRAHLIRERESYEDLMRRDRPLPAEGSGSWRDR